MGPGDNPGPTFAASWPAVRAGLIGLLTVTAFLPPFATMLIIGPPLAAPLLFTIGYEWALLANAMSYLDCRCPSAHPEPS